MLSLIAVIAFWTLCCHTESNWDTSPTGSGQESNAITSKAQGKIKQKSQITGGTNMTKGCKAERTKTNMEREHTD